MQAPAHNHFAGCWCRLLPFQPSCQAVCLLTYSFLEFGFVLDTISALQAPRVLLLHGYCSPPGAGSAGTGGDSDCGQRAVCHLQVRCTASAAARCTHIRVATLCRQKCQAAQQSMYCAPAPSVATRPTVWRLGCCRDVKQALDQLSYCSHYFLEDLVEMSEGVYEAGLGS